MNCGVPFCQSGIRWEGRDFGCPLHNLIPEWNDMIYAGNPSHALSRLLKTNNFPEFTGRVCPAPCEEACICGMYGDAVTIRDNELSVIEEAFAAGAVEVVIEFDDLAGLNTLAELGVFTGKNIDGLIELVNSTRKPEILSYLTNYKNTEIGITETDYEL